MKHFSIISKTYWKQNSSMKDIVARYDIEQLVDEFYRRIREDDMVGFIFTDIVKIDWEKHLPVMYDFWDNIIFLSGKYTGNPMDLHKNLHNIRPINNKHFSRWLEVFLDTVDDLFEGENAELAKQRAKNITSIIREKVILQKNI